MAVPTIGVSAIKLHKSHAALDQAPRQQTTQPELRSRFVIQAVKLFRSLALFRNVHYFGSVSLHSEGEFISRDAGAEFGVFFATRQAGAIQFVNELDGIALLVIRN